ncbi:MULTISPECIES: F0F1 ATP synthase subunit A [Bdellovibrio]|uniref:ATP synthase subunit a n=1 Tax=Bdellovibrio bacteriovorus TaxID=959 RepID=A0A150WWH4_BDEBC|nr:MULTISPECIES: F0F1 ATP synthase subunit A [Bdellovibrio]KHD87257.1 MAG: ATP synthase subunit A [Bdellovibrio sp. ArHS]KYG68981.1 ATP synthase subunit A [Bdellovibrio bacteriovorus]KYG70877.1 ATP synthase subunit A [Bdellovibrio bacteriovorus]
MSFNWTQLIPGVGHEYAHVATLGAATVATMAIGMAARASLGKGETAVLPASKFSLRGIMEMLTEMMDGLAEMVIGEHGKHYVPFFTSVFFFILLNNLIGMIPGMTPATENINTTFGFGVLMFLFYNFQGVKENGVFAYLKHFMGPVLFLAPLMFVIELVSHFVRPFSLGLRLANVMMGDHTVLSVFLDLVPIGVPIPFYIMGLFVCFVQAFVFTLLSMVYVAFAIAHDH